jgi:hypothetical protein
MYCELGLSRIKDQLMRQAATRADEIHSRLQTLERELSSLTGSLEVRYPSISARCLSRTDRSEYLA